MRPLGVVDWWAGEHWGTSQFGDWLLMPQSTGCCWGPIAWVSLFLLSVGGSVTLEGGRAGVLGGPVLAVRCWVGCWGSGQIPAAGLPALGPSCPLGLSSWDLGAYCLLVS